MKRSFSLASLGTLVALAGLAACSDAPTSLPKPASIAVLSGDAQTVVVGQTVPVVPSFVVRDASGNPIDGLAVHVAITAGGGTLIGAPTRTTGSATGIGTWTLGKTAGTNTLSISVDGLAPLLVSASATPGAAAAITPLTPTSLAARAGDVATPAPSFRVADAFGNVVPNATVAIAASAGSAPASITTDASGIATVTTWQVGTTAGQSTLTATAGSATASFVAAVASSDPTQLIVSGDQQRGRAGAPASPISVRVADKYGNAIPNQTATFAVTGGAGTLTATSAASAADGTIAMPTWTFGRIARVQSAHVSAGGFAADINIPIATDFKIDVRFFGGDMTDEQKSWFTNAAARISAIITGDIPDAPVANLDVSQACGITGLPVMNETIDDLVIYASVSAIDGPGKILAEAGPCVYRNATDGLFSAVGVMLFDSADMASMAQSGMTQDVITHEMLHVVGIGTLWEDKSLLIAAGTSAVTYTGASGKSGCLAGGGSIACATGVPVENNGVIGTADAHWRESTFGNELMTGYANTGGMPLSAITVGSLADIGYIVNPLAADPYQLPGTGTGATGNRIPRLGGGDGWERHTPAAVILGSHAGDTPTFIRRAP